MEVKTSRLAGSRVEILFEIAWQEFGLFLDRAAARLSQNLKVPGFRPGKMPREIVEKEVGQDKVLAEAAELAIKKEYPKYVLEKEIEVIGSPQVEILKLAPGNPFCFRAKVDILPEIKLPDYKKIAAQVEKKEVTVSDKEVGDALKWLQKSRAEFHNLARPSKKGDFVEIEYQSPQIENNRVFEDRFLLGKGHFVQGFEKNLEGMQPAEEKEFSVDFPKSSSHKHLAGKKVNFRVKVKKVQEMNLPELNDEFAKGLGKFKGLSSLKESVKEGIRQEKEVAEKERWRGEILKRLAEQSRFEVPEVLVGVEQERMSKEFRERIEKGLKLPFPDYLKQVKKTAEEIRESFEREARRKVANFLILREIGKQEKITVKEEEVEEAAKRQKEVDLDPERLKEYYKGVLYNEKVFQVLENS